MNRIPLFHRSLLTRVIAFVTICSLPFLFPAHGVMADGAPPPEPDIGGVAPYQPIETNVQMMSETVLIDILPSPSRWLHSESPWNSNRVKVKASFTLRNQGTTAEQMQVIFPLSRLDYPWVTSSYNIDSSTFVASVNGKLVSTTGLSTPPGLQATPEGWDSTALPDGLFLPDVQWTGFDVTFPVQEDVIVDVEYEMRGYVGIGLYQVDYILETGAGWYGNIQSANIIVRFPYAATEESIPHTAPGCVFSGNEVHCSMKNFEPKRKDNLSFGFVDTNEWVPILELRSRVEQYPDDAQAWYRLARQYDKMSFWRFGGQVGIRNPHLVELSIEAFEKAIDLNPTWGDAHLGLAHVLWYGNPKWAGRGTVERMEFSAKDPYVQRVLLEMQLAASHGIAEEFNGYDGLVVEIFHFVPDLEPSLLPEPIRLRMSPDATQVPLPTTDSIAKKVVGLEAGNYQTCILTSIGEVHCKGLNVKNHIFGDIQSVAVGDYYTCLLSAEGGVQCMGQNNFGQLGDGTTIDKSTPVDVIGLTEDVASIVTGDNHTCALMKDGLVKCWGRNYFGQLGNGTTAYSLLPVEVVGLTAEVVELAAGNDHTCALLASGGVQCWGANEAGQLGDGSLTNQLAPVDVAGLQGQVTALAAGFSHTCALDSQGELLCWGDNSHGQLGDEDHTVHTKPTMIAGLDADIVKITSGNGFNCVLASTGGVKCWGRNDSYQNLFGDYNPEERFTPTDVVGFTAGVIDIASGNDHSCAILQNGQVKCWGLTEYGGYWETQTDNGNVAESLPTPVFDSVPSTPATVQTVGSNESSSPVVDLVWDLGLLAGLGALLLLLRRSRKEKR